MLAEEHQAALADAGLTCGAVCLRYPSPEFSAGALTHPDAAVRAKAVALTVEACDWAVELGTDEVVVWSAYDGYDYAFQCDYDDLWARLVASFRAVCDARPATRVSLEFKPTDERTRWFAVPSTGAALLLCHDVDRANFGLTLDVGHCLAAGENPAQSVAAVAARGRLFGVQLNDGYTRLGAEDGLIFGSVHALAAREVVYWLRRARFAGHVYFDTFPRNEDPVRECELNIRQVRRLYDAAGDLDVADAQRGQDGRGRPRVREEAVPRADAVLEVEARAGDRGHDAGHAHDPVAQHAPRAVEDDGRVVAVVVLEVERRPALDLLDGGRVDVALPRSAGRRRVRAALQRRRAVAAVAAEGRAVEVHGLAVVEVRAVVAEPVADEDRRRLDAAAVPQQAPVLAAEAAELVAVAAVGAAGAEELAAVERRVDGRVVEAGPITQCIGARGRRGEAHRRDKRRQAPQRGHLKAASCRISGSPCLAGFPCGMFTIEYLAHLLSRIDV